MQIGKGEEIARVPLLLVRDFFRDIVAWHRDSFELAQLEERLNLSRTAAIALAEELIVRGYVTRGQNHDYRLTNRGEELVRASASGRVKRGTAESALAGLLKRAEEYNSDASKILAVDAVAVFGSFLSDKEELGDLDVAVKWRDRVADDHRSDRAHAYAERSGRKFSNVIEFLTWPQTELFQILKARKRTICIQDWHAFIRLVAKDPDNFAYRIVFGAADRMTAEIKAAVEQSTPE